MCIIAAKCFAFAAAAIHGRIFSGKSFFKKKKQPIAIDLEAKDWAGQIKKALRSTYMFKTGGSCITIR